MNSLKNLWNDPGGNCSIALNMTIKWLDKMYILSIKKKYNKSICRQRDYSNGPLDFKVLSVTIELIGNILKIVYILCKSHWLIKSWILISSLGFHKYLPYDYALVINRQWCRNIFFFCEAGTQNYLIYSLLFVQLETVLGLEFFNI